MTQNRCPSRYGWGFLIQPQAVSFKLQANTKYSYTLRAAREYSYKRQAASCKRIQIQCIYFHIQHSSSPRSFQQTNNIICSGPLRMVERGFAILIFDGEVGIG